MSHPFSPHNLHITAEERSSGGWETNLAGTGGGRDLAPVLKPQAYSAMTPRGACWDTHYHHQPGACKGQSKERALVLSYSSSCCFSVLQRGKLSHGGHSDLSKLWEQQGLCLDVGKG